MSDHRDHLYVRPEDDVIHVRTRIWTGRVMAIIAVLLLLLNGSALERWAARQPPGWASETLRQISDVWNERTGLAGFDGPRDWVQDRRQDLLNLSWSDLSTWRAQEPFQHGDALEDEHPSEDDNSSENEAAPIPPAL